MAGRRPPLIRFFPFLMHMEKLMRKISLAAIALGALVLTSGPALAATRLLETGSSLLYPLMNLWVASYQQAHPDVEITTQSTGSGTGISQSIAGVAQIGASDAYLAEAQMKQSPMFNIPLAISAQQINYNIPGLNDKHLNLSAPVLAKIYSGTIGFWDDAAIKAINPSLASKLPHEAIVPIRRSDGSGDTFLFTSYLTMGAKADWSAGMGTSVQWPAVSNEVGANGNPGMLQTCQNTRYSIAYVGISFLDQANKAGLGYAALGNASGKFVLPDAATVGAAAAAGIHNVPSDGRASLILSPGAKSYPIINFEYGIINPKQKDKETRDALVAFLKWAIAPSGGNNVRYLSSVRFLPLPSGVAKIATAMIDQIGT